MLLSRFLGSLVLILLIQGCADLKAIQDFANISAQSAEYTQLVENYLEFPNRQKRYQNPERHSSLDTMARERITQKAELLLQHQVIEEYMKALRQLAADEILDQSQEIAQLSTAMKTQTSANPAKVDALRTITTTLTNAVSDKWRQRQLQELIGRTNAPLQTVLKSLRQTVVEGFGSDDQNEQFAINSYYRTKIAESTDPAGIAALKEWQEFRGLTLSSHKQMIETYATVLEEIAEAHQQLYDQRQNLTAAGLVKKINGSTQSLRRLLRTIKQL